MEYLTNKYSMDNVLEKYIGRKPELIQIEKHLEVIVNRIRNEVESLTTRGTDVTAHDINKSSENVKIEKLFKKLFGFKDFVLNWLWTPIPDAHTLAKAYQILDSNYKKRDDGSDYNSRLFVSVNVSTGMITLMDLDASEILAIILHEIGHSFNRTIGQVLSTINPIVISMKGMGGVDWFKPYNFLGGVVFDVLPLTNLYGYTRRYLEQFKHALKPFFKIYNRFMEIVAYVFSVIPQSLVTAGNVTLLLKPMNFFFLYGVEKHSDGFAVDYGYGKEMASALNKLDRSFEHPKMSIPVLNWMYAFDDMVHEMILEPLSGYPNMHNRQRSALDRLRAAAKDPDLDPKTRKELENQIKNFEAYYEEYMKLQENENSKYFFTWLYRKFVDKLFNGKMDIRELVYAFEKDNPRNHGYVKAYDKALKK